MEKRDRVNKAFDILVRIGLFPIMLPVFLIMTLLELYWIIKSWFFVDWEDMWT